MYLSFHLIVYLKKGRVYVNIKAVKQSSSQAVKQSSSQAVKHHLGFTLSELLVSLAVLGLIAGLTVPSVVVSIDRSKTRSILREAFQTISAITQAGVLNGDFAGITDWDVLSSSNPQGIVGYVRSKLNYSKQCLTTDITSDGCKRGWSGAAANDTRNAHNARFILPNGAKLQAHEGTSSNSMYPWNATNMLWTVTAKAYANDMNAYNANPDTILISCNVTDATQTINGVVMKSGMCGGWDTSTWTAQMNIALGYT
jgi:prepilin-type N-terminal cleavage/methylation domain-containing protein